MGKTPPTLPGWAAAAPVARLATISGSRPHIVPVVFCEINGDLYIPIDGKPKSGARLKRLDNIQRNPAVSVLVDEYHEDWSKLRWVRIDGQATEIQGNPSVSGALSGKYPQYRQTELGKVAIRITVDRVQSWSAQ